LDRSQWSFRIFFAHNESSNESELRIEWVHTFAEEGNEALGLEGDCPLNQFKIEEFLSICDVYAVLHLELFNIRLEKPNGIYLINHEQLKKQQIIGL